MLQTKFSLPVILSVLCRMVVAVTIIFCFMCFYFITQDSVRCSPTWRSYVTFDKLIKIFNLAVVQFLTHIISDCFCALELGDFVKLRATCYLNLIVFMDYTCLYSSVGIESRYWLDGPGIVSRWGSRFSAPVQTGPGAHPASCTMGTGSFSEGKRG